MMGLQEPVPSPLKGELSDDDRLHITEVFEEEVVPKLRMMDARAGNLNCSFAGEEYCNWVVQFRPTRFGFEIVDFEYDENSRSFELPPGRLIKDIA